MQFVDQVVNQQTVPQQTARKHHDVSACVLFEGGNHRVGIRPFDDARIRPGGDVIGRELIRK